MGKELEVKSVVSLDDGVHSGVIVEVEFREEPYDYTDLWISYDNEDNKLRVSYPTYLSRNSKLGQLLERFGFTLKVGEKLDVEKMLVGKTIVFQTVTKKNKDGKEFANVIPESVKLSL